MPLLAVLTRVLLLHRLLGGGARRRRPARFGRPPRRRDRGGFGFLGPFPSYSRRTRGGGRVSVSGCCLPIPLALVLGASAAVRLLARR